MLVCSFKASLLPCVGEWPAIWIEHATSSSIRPFLQRSIFLALISVLLEFMWIKDDRDE